MIQTYKKISMISLGMLIASTTILKSAVDSIVGDTGSAQTGPITLTGGTSGATFDSSSGTITQAFNYLSLPLTTSSQGQILINGEPTLHTYSDDNQNIFVGTFAGNFGLTSLNTTACGASALNSLESGDMNTAVGHAGLINLTSGLGNTVVGDNAGGGIIDGSYNLLAGQGAGSSYFGSESQNIIIGAGNPGATGENLVIRIGGGQTQLDCYIDGIYGSSNDSGSALPVYIDDGCKLATVVSTVDAKENIKDIGTESTRIFKLRPISFNYKTDPNKKEQFGLLAEEVDKVFKELVVYRNGKPYSVRYDELPVLILNEFQKQQNDIKDLEHTINQLSAQIAKLEAQLYHCCPAA